MAVERIRTAVRRQLAADVRCLRDLEQDIASLERHIDQERRRLAALDPTVKPRRAEADRLDDRRRVCADAIKSPKRGDAKSPGWVDTWLKARFADLAWHRPKP